MAVERENPLPAGRYSVTLLGNLQIEVFDEWLRRNHEFVLVRQSELDPESKPVTSFVVFDVDQPAVVRWEGPGFPNIVKSGETPTLDEFEQTPETPEPLDQLASFFESVRPAMPVLLLLGVAYLWSKGSKS